jgi:DNA invertase Pin-like site-specific DNA recombinase
MQRHETAELVERRGWKLHADFADEGISGAHGRRPAFQAMMKAARQRRFDCLIVYRCDRLFRSLKDLVWTIDELASLGIGFCSVHEAFDTTTAQGRLMLGLIASVAEFERSVLVERTKSGLAAAKRRGVQLGRPRVAVDVRRAEQLRALGKSFKDVASALGVGVGTLHRALSEAKRTVN